MVTTNKKINLSGFYQELSQYLFAGIEEFLFQGKIEATPIYDSGKWRVRTLISESHPSSEKVKNKIADLCKKFVKNLLNGEAVIKVTSEKDYEFYLAFDGYFLTLLSERLYVDTSGLMDENQAILYHPKKELYFSNLTDIEVYVNKNIENILDEINKPFPKTVSSKKKDLTETCFKIDKILRESGVNFKRPDQNLSDGSAYYFLDRGSKYSDMDYLNEYEKGSLYSEEFEEFNKKYNSLVFEVRNFLQNEGFENGRAELDLDDTKGHLFLNIYV